MNAIPSEHGARCRKADPPRRVWWPVVLGLASDNSELSVGDRNCASVLHRMFQAECSGQNVPGRSRGAGRYACERRKPRTGAIGRHRLAAIFAGSRR